LPLASAAAKEEESSDALASSSAAVSKVVSPPSLFLPDAPAETEGTAGMAAAAVAAAMAAEERMVAVDAERKEDKEKVNRFESFLYATRALSDADGPHADLLDASWLGETVDAAEEWFYAEERSGSVCAQRQEELQKSVKEKFSSYYDAVAKDRAKKEASMRAAQEKLEAEKAAAEAAGEGKDFDRRNMKTSGRVRLAAKNKAEGNELIRSKNYTHACRRYINALQHCDKAYANTLSPKEKEEVDALALTIRLNLAQCWLKLEKYEKAIENCNKALDFDKSSTKGLYRRALAYEKLKDFKRAKADVAWALATKPANDKALLKLKARIMKHIAKQKAKERKMCKNMFG